MHKVNSKMIDNVNIKPKKYKYPFYHFTAMSFQRISSSFSTNNNSIALLIDPSPPAYSSLTITSHQPMHYHRHPTGYLSVSQHINPCQHLSKRCCVRNTHLPLEENTPTDSSNLSSISHTMSGINGISSDGGGGISSNSNSTTISSYTTDPSHRLQPKHLNRSPLLHDYESFPDTLHFHPKRWLKSERPVLWTIDEED
ncbi:hypothetical protein BDF14DRAFT_1800925 [Spinellus fusiger]|nr:hypothetical protein BDF14DRAFT_1800925 [Spinellus fusiger]